MQLLTAFITDKGGREVNQDYVNYIQLEDSGCWVVADGLGGLLAGEVASKLASEVILEEYLQTSTQDWLRSGIEKAQAAIHEQQRASQVKRSMRTTIVVLYRAHNLAKWAHVGDSRLYHFRNQKVIDQTKDHSICQALVNAGEITYDQIRYHEDRNRLFRVLGTDGDVKATIVNNGVYIQPGDAFLLCTDGFWEYVTEEEMESTINSVSTPLEWLQKMEGTLKSRVPDRNDNYSALAVFVH